MPSISKIRLTNVVYEEGNKRYNDELFLFDGNNGAILLENGGGKTVFIQTALQAIIPHATLAERKVKETLLLENAPAHIAIEWIISEQPRRYLVTCVSLFLTKNGLDSLRYVYEYSENEPYSIENIPFVKMTGSRARPADRGEMMDFYQVMKERSIYARTFDTIKDYRFFLEEQYQIILSEWESIVKINSTEGGVEAFFDECKSTNALFDRLLIPTVEDSMAGHNPHVFADLFEKQRANFKAYKDLKDSIEEYKTIQQELENYVAIYAQLHAKEMDYEKVKEDAKGLWGLINEQKQEVEKGLTENSVTKVEWEKEQLFYRLQKASYDWLIQERQFNVLDEDYKMAFNEFTKFEEKLVKTKSHYYSLKLAGLKLERINHEAQLAVYIEKLLQLGQSDEEIDIEDQLEETRMALAGFYREQIDEMEKLKTGLLHEMRPIEEELGQLTNQFDETNKQKLQAENDAADTSGQIKTHEKALNHLKKQLVASENEDVRHEFNKWNMRIQFLEEEINRKMQEEKQTKLDINASEKRKDALNDELKSAISERQKWLSQQEAQKNAHQQMTNRLATLRPQWAGLDNIYLQEDSIKSRIEEVLESLKHEREVLHHMERLAFRFVDDYGNQDAFFSDAYIEQQLKSWRNQFDVVKTGIEFLQEMSIEEFGRYSGYLLWPLTLITTSKSKRSLLEKIANISDQLQFPISVVTMDDVAKMELDMSEDAWVVPKHWEHAQDPHAFAEWKKAIYEKADDASNRLKEKEQQITEYEDVLKDFYKFLDAHPFDIVTNTKEELTRLDNLIDEKNIMVNQETKIRTDLKNKLETIRSNIQHYREEKTGLERKAEKASEYLLHMAELSQLKKQKLKNETDAQELDKVLKRLNKEIEKFKDEKQNILERIQQNENNINRILDDDKYAEVKHYIPRYTDEGKSVILERLKELEFELRKVQITRGEWEANKESELQAIESIDNQMKDLRKEQDGLDETLLFPIDGKSLMESLHSKYKNLENDVASMQKDLEEKHSAKEFQRGNLNNIESQFRKDFPVQERFVFTDTLEVIPDVLASELKGLIEKQKYLDSEQKRLQTECKAIENAERELERFIEGHHFNAPDIKTNTWNLDRMTAFVYDRLGVVKGITKSLRESKEKVEDKKTFVERGRRSFREFCNHSITSVKMRNMALNGIEHKETYEDIITFKNNMMVSVDRASKYANEEIRSKDAGLQAFINQIHHHLQSIVEELGQIPKKTKIKVGDQWKQIYELSIPSWEEDVGKNRIRDYIEWVLKQLESDRFTNEYGEEDHGKVRKEIEMWLQSKQLLQVVMNNEVMKVSCRKVTNDIKVTTRPYSWEQSNIWSGGEKWSKNMTLFLGILKYVAEKKQQIQPKMKRHRVVILDNPFGKASSDHVLSPVFFVAEQLGFQIIALTAHAEGKFLQDYFPIIYSLRLRSSIDPNKKVMTKEKYLHHAYFQDHNPDSLDRLGETVQIELFE